MYHPGDLAFVIKKELVGGPWTGKSTLTMTALLFPVEVKEVTTLEGCEELVFLVKYLGEEKTEVVYSFNLTNLH